MQRLNVSSQSIAQLLSLIAGLLLIPGLPGALFGLYVVFFLRSEGFSGGFRPQVTRDQWGAGMIIITMLVVGSVLLWGYVRHAGTRPVWGGSVLLWLMTGIYNGALLNWVYRNVTPSAIPWLVVPLMLWWLTAIVLAFIAGALDLRALSRSHR